MNRGTAIKCGSYFKRCSDTEGFQWVDIEAAGFDTFFRAAHDETVDEILLSAFLHAPHLFKAVSIRDIFRVPAEPVLDPNHIDRIKGDREGIYRIPLSTKGGVRNGVTNSSTPQKSTPYTEKI
jgi:hypothetical protein